MIFDFCFCSRNFYMFAASSFCSHGQGIEVVVAEYDCGYLGSASICWRCLCFWCGLFLSLPQSFADTTSQRPWVGSVVPSLVSKSLSCTTSYSVSSFRKPVAWWLADILDVQTLFMVWKLPLASSTLLLTSSSVPSVLMLPPKYMNLSTWVDCCPYTCIWSLLPFLLIACISVLVVFIFSHSCTADMHPLCWRVAHACNVRC